MRAVLRNVAKKYQKEIADKLCEALEDQIKMQVLSLELKNRGYSKAFLIPLNGSNWIYPIIGPFPRITGRRSGLPMEWKGSIKN